MYFNCFTIYTSNIYTNVFRVKRIELELGKPWYKRFVTWSHALSHLGRRLLHGSLRIIKPQPRFIVCNISYLLVLFHSSYLLLTFRYIHHKKIKGKEYIHVTILFTSTTRKSPQSKTDIWVDSHIWNMLPVDTRHTQNLHLPGPLFCCRCVGDKWEA